MTDIRLPRPLPPPEIVWIDPKTGRLTKNSYDYLRELDNAVRDLIAKVNTL